MGVVRGVWTFILPGLGFVVTWLTDMERITVYFSVPVALVLGAFLYALKRYFWPDTEF
jgi:hypothetical protein